MSDALTDTDDEWSSKQSMLAPGSVMVTATAAEPWGQALLTQKHVLFADEPAAQNGRDTGPDPHELALMALGACTAITVRMYAARKGWPIERLDVRLSFLKRPGAYVIATTVETHNRLGRLYMLPVGRVHKAIVRLMMRGLEI